MARRSSAASTATFIFGQLGKPYCWASARCAAARLVCAPDACSSLACLRNCSRLGLSGSFPVETGVDIWTSMLLAGGPLPGSILVVETNSGRSVGSALSADPDAPYRAQGSYHKVL